MLDLKTKAEMQVNYNLLEPVLTVFVANGERYNLLNSVVLELFDFIWREGIKSLTIYFTDKLWPLVEDVSPPCPVGCSLLSHPPCQCCHSLVLLGSGTHGKGA